MENTRDREAGVGQASVYEEGRNHSMLQDLRRLLGNPPSTDVIFLCGKERQQVPAHRLLVSLRSPQLQATLLRSENHAQPCHIELPHIDASTMRICIEFFYTDTVREESWLDFQSFVEVIAAAKYFLVAKLEDLAITHIEYQLITHDEQKVQQPAFDRGLMKAYNRAAFLYRSHPSRPMQKMLEQMVAHIRWASRYWKLRRFEFEFEPLQHLDQDALVFYLQNIKLWQHVPSNRADVYRLEYQKFYTLLLWCASQYVYGCKAQEASFAYAMDSAIGHFLPWYGEFDVQDFLSAKSANNHDHMDTSKLELIQALRDQVLSCLEKLDGGLFRLSPTVMSGIIEPLGLLPDSMLLTAYRLQALNPGDLHWDDFGHYNNYRLVDSGLDVLSCETDRFEGFARCSMPIGLPGHMTFAWEVLISEPTDHLRVGFCLKRNLLPKEYDRFLLGDCAWSWALSSNGNLYHDSKRVRARYCSHFHSRNEVKVGVHLNLNERTCSFSIDGVVQSIAWRDLPKHERVYPAVSMQSPSRAQLRMIFADWMINPRRIAG
ncbi:hypothetical protein GOP47_0009923 [Adiantum capillus-veneris]|uniref:BTB domain-containing protein n=1 Tax=Adiantum capillus-veneris TaxID=13818 RepID=A0A9D4ZJ61_ADICA|nr:hypothetical protein GOP47_0009923 [Adiantum capillus-veneris]